MEESYNKCDVDKKKKHVADEHVQYDAIFIQGKNL